MRRITSCVPSVEPVSTMTHVETSGRAEVRQRAMIFASFFTIMFRQSVGFMGNGSAGPPFALPRRPGGVNGYRGCDGPRGPEAACPGEDAHDRRDRRARSRDKNELS